MNSRIFTTFCSSSQRKKQRLQVDYFYAVCVVVDKSSLTIMLGSYLYLLFFVLPVIHSARDCLEIFEGGITQSGVYKIEVIPGIPINVSCDMSNGGGWTVFQRYHPSPDRFYALICLTEIVILLEEQ